MDSDNILSILQGLGQSPQASAAPQAPDAPQAPAAPPTNVLQSVAQAPVASPAPPAQPADVASAATAASPPMPKPRRSLLDTIGRISDVLATVGGSQALYQPTLDARADRALALGDHSRKVDMDKLDMATKQAALTGAQNTAADSERSRLGNVLSAINDKEDAAGLPAMMQAAGLTDPKYAPFIKMVQDDPDPDQSVAKRLASALGADSGDDTGKTIKTGYDSKGNRIAYVVDSEGNAHILSGVTPDANFKVVNTGDKTSLVGPNGLPTTIIPNKVSPNTAANNAQSNTNNQRTTSTNLTIAGMPARAQPGKTASTANTSADALSALDNIQGGFDRLHNMGALAGDPNTPSATLEGAFGRTALGQKIGAQFGNKAAQERLALQKNLSNLQSYMISSLPGSATRTKFEQEIQKQRLPDPMQMDYPTATRVIGELRQSYQRALSGANAEVSAKAAPKSALPAGWENAPTVSPSDAAKLPSGAKFISLDGRALVRP